MKVSRPGLRFFMATQHVKVDLKGLIRYRQTVEADLRGSGSGPVRGALRQWGARARAYWQERFDKNSRGGGDWPPLSVRTMARRRKARKGARGKPRQFSILRDTGTMFAALVPDFQRKPGQLQQDIAFGVKVGYGGPHRHPKGKATIADIASFHQEGKGNLPAREIILALPGSVTQQMAGDMGRALERLARDTDKK